MHHRNTEWI